MNVLHKTTLIKRVIKSNIALLFILLLTACDKHVVYYTYQPTSSVGWLSSDTLSYEIPIKSTTTPLYFQSEVRYTAQYPYINLSIELTHHLRDSSKIQRDTLHYQLMDNEGKRGANNWSCLYESTLPLQVSVQDTGIYQVKIRHIMQNDTLPGIHDVGMKIMR